MKCLLVKPPFAMWIVQGVKTVEYRKRQTQIRGRIGILECAPLKPIGRGTREIIGDVELWNCADYYKNGLVGWDFRNARRYKHPVIIPFPHGAQTWINVDYEVPAEFYPELSTAERNKLEAEKLFTESDFLRKYLVHEEEDDAQYSIQEIELPDTGFIASAEQKLEQIPANLGGTSSTKKVNLFRLFRMKYQKTFACKSNLIRIMENDRTGNNPRNPERT